MHSIRNILVGVDLDAKTKQPALGSGNALAQAKWLAQSTGARLTILHSSWNDTYFEPVSKQHLVVHEGATQGELDALEALVASARGDGIDCQLSVVDERPLLAITHAVLRGEADLVIVGKRNDETGEGRRVGSVALNLMRQCPAPVWVVKPEHDLVHKLVLSATDLTAVGSQAVAFGAFVAARHECELHVVHAYQVSMELQMEASRLPAGEYEKRIEAIKQNAVNSIEGALRGSELAKEPEIHIGRNTPAGAIKEAVEHLHPDLLVMGTISRSGIAGLLVGNTAERLLERVDCSLLTVKPADFVSPITLD